jgi:hypothetical protein
MTENIGRCRQPSNEDKEVIMTRALLAFLFAAGVAVPALAQALDAQADCELQVNQVRAELETANVDEADRADIDAALTEAEQAAVAGDDATCSAIVEQVLAQLPAQ